ncbi:acyltransferase [Streptomyces sp. ACT015]|uniref:acyltransferase n=1 Tax=Streptomyces sp. ACT015 TaxID=3134807 RepID=UPI003D17383E
MDQRQETSSGRFDHCPWLFADGATEEQRAAQLARRTALDGDSEVGERCYVAESAAVFTDRLRLGADSYIAAHAYVTGELTTGAHCTLNPFTTVRGTVRLGEGVRIGAHTSLLGFNHSMEPDRPVHRQPLTSRGIEIGDDVWIGSHVVVVDGVRVGDHCVIGAGAVVTRDLPAWTVAAGNPARPLRDRRAPRTAGGTGGTPRSLTRFADTARSQAAGLLSRAWDGDRYRDRPGAPATVRAHCDAVEIADLLLGSAPGQLAPEEHVRRLASAQDPRSGLVPELGEPLPPEEEDGFTADGAALYHVLSVGYALDLLGASFPHPVRAVRDMTVPQLLARLDGLPWRERAWNAGAWVDAWATAAHWNLRHGASGGGTVEALFGALVTRVDPWTGLWGTPSAEDGRLQVVNGYYRLTRGSFAQFGVPVPSPERVVDAVLDHSRDPRWFGAGRETACTVLDVAHPLWLCARQLGAGGYRSADVRDWAEGQLAAVLPRWRDGEGFGFGPGADGPGPRPGLQGTEMWLAIVWYLADLLGRSDELGYRPRGVHRPEPARTGLGPFPG